MSLTAYPQQRVLCPLPETLPRQKAYTYLCLICLTCLLIYFYSYPLDTDSWSYVNLIGSYEENSAHNSDAYETGLERNSKIQNYPIKDNISGANNGQLGNTTSITQEQRTPSLSNHSLEVSLQKDKMGNNDDFSRTVQETSISRITSANPLTVSNKLKSNREQNTATRGRTITTSVKQYASEKNWRRLLEKRRKTTRSTHKTLPPIEEHSSTVPKKDFAATSSELYTRSTTTGNLLQQSTSSTSAEQGTSAAIKETKEYFSQVKKGYLVFSENCRIPDIDPMDSSIAHLIEKNPPLDCSKDYEPLTSTDGHVLFLNDTAIRARTQGENYSCCYRSVFRASEGISDDEVGFGDTCIGISNQTRVKDEFITVECKHQNGTSFYKEFHSFIFDKSKVEKRCKKKGNESNYSVLIVGVDAVSRLNMHRQLNATASYLLKEMHATEMYGFNKVGDNTFPNLVPLMMGYDERELPSVCWKSDSLPLDRCNFLWNAFAKKGYRTFYAEDTPYISTFNYVKEGFYHQPTDYYFRHFILAYEDALGRDKPLNCHKCVGSTSETEAVLHWMQQFASHFANRTYFAFSWINSITHDFLNTGSSVDHVYEAFFRTLHQSGALDKTIVVLMGDHGMRWGDIRNTYVGRLEERLPMLVIALPTKFKKEYPQFAQTLQENSHRLTTPFDLHATLMHLIHLEGDWTLKNTDDISEALSKNFTTRAMSLFQRIPQERSCDDAFIEEHWCTCETSLEVEVDSQEVKTVAKLLLNHINSLLKPVSAKCAFLTLNSISNARLWQPPAEHKGHSANDNIYTAVIKTNPGKGVFEGTVKISKFKTDGELLGAVSRLNLYGNQSLCINNAVLKKYCFCL